MRFVARRVSFILGIILFQFWVFLPSSNAQQQKVSLTKQVSFEWVLNQQQKRTGLGFVYSAHILRNTPLLDIDTAKALIEMKYTRCLEWLNLNYDKIGPDIIIKSWRGPRLTGVVADTGEPGGPAQRLDEIVVVPYQNTTQRRTTATVFQLKAEDLTYPANDNLLDAMEGQIPGLTIRHLNGVPGSAFETLLGGRHSIQQGNDPLYVIDGVPLATNGFLSTVGHGSAQGPAGASLLSGFPRYLMNTIGVMHDPAATTLYGSRASNGVILGTLRQGRAGPLSWTVDVNYGFTKAVSTSPLLNTAQFMKLRQEAIANDNQPLNDTSLPERKWGGRSTDFKRIAIGNTGWVRDAKVDLTGGDIHTQYLLSGRYFRESTVFPGSNYDQHLLAYGNLHHQTRDRGLRLNFSGLYNRQDLHLPQLDFGQFQYLAPNAPPFFDAGGKAQWGDTVTPIVNIPAQNNNFYRGSVSTLLGHAQAVWEFAPFFFADASLGYNGIFTRETSVLSAAGQLPFLSPKPVDQSSWASNNYSSQIAEVTVKYFGPLGPGGRGGQLDALAGVTWQNQQTSFSSKLEPNPRAEGGAPVSVDNRYKALFGRATYVFEESYILSAAWRRDASNKFGPGYRYGDFYSLGAGWIFRQEDENGGFSFGKIKGSYGTTGNDQINPHLYDTATARMARKNLSWERSRQVEAGIDLGFVRNKLFFSANAFRSWSQNQLIYSVHDPFTGEPAHFSSRTAEVVNEGLEFSLEARDLRLGNVRWSSRLILTVPKNVLRRFPNLDSSLLSTVVVGRSLTATRGYHYTGVDPQQGYYSFQGVDLDNPAAGGKIVPSPSLDAKYYGGWTNSFRYRNWEWRMFLDYRRQNGLNPLVILDKYNPPGVQNPSQLSNGPVEWMQHWQHRGDLVAVQRLTTGYDGRAMTALGLLQQSDAVVTDASYLRVKMMSAAYRFNTDQLKRLRGIESLSFYLRAENLLTVSRFPVTDPETQDPTVLPPLRAFSVGFTISLKNKAGR